MSYKGLNNKISPRLAVVGGDLKSFGSSMIRDLRQTFINFYEDVRERAPYISEQVTSRTRMGLRTTFQRLKNSNFGWRRFGKKAGIGIGIILLILLIIAGGRKVFSSISSSTSSGNRIEVQGAKATQEINKEFSFPLKNDKGEEVSKIKYDIQSAELRDEIIVQGQKATAVKGRTFLIITLKITNELNQTIQINSRDYIRLSVNGNESELLAPDIHNDPVEVQAISTKYTRVGFPINDSDKNLVLLVGEISGDKEKIPLNLN